MAVAPQLATSEIVDLRHVRSRALAPLLDDEQREWREQLYWDYRPSAEMIRRHVDARNLPGYAALHRGQPVGYCFFVFEDDKALIGDLYVREGHRVDRPQGAPAGLATLLLEHTLETLEHTPAVRRIETQLVPFGLEPLAPLFARHHFRCFPRLFMYKELVSGKSGKARARAGEERSGQGAPVILPWEDRYFEPMAELVQAAYRDHVDSHINNHYESRDGALRFLKNIVLFPGCGVFSRDTSLVVLDSTSTGRHPADRLLAAVLTSQVSPRVAHITQLCVRPEAHGQGLARRLMATVEKRLKAKGAIGVSLSVTAENHRAVGLYHRRGYAVIKGFAAYSRNLSGK